MSRVRNLLVGLLVAGVLGVEGAKKYIVMDDMILLPKQYNFMYSNDSSKRHGSSLENKQWPGGVVRYSFASNLDRYVKAMYLNAIKKLEEVSCIRFERSTEGNHILVVNSDGCVSFVGNLKRGEQKLFLSSKCGLGGAIHETLHALGFYHMHTEVSRDEYVKIDWSNIIPDMKSNFEKFTAHVSMFGTDYDYSSIMHYPEYAFAIKDWLPTIIPLKKGASRLMNRKEMSQGDITRLNRMYKCEEKQKKNDERS